LLYVGQCLQSGGITEVRTPLAPPREGPYFSNAPLLGRYLYTKAPNQRLFHSAVFKKTQELEFLEDVKKIKEQPKFQCWLILDTNMLQQ